MIIAVPVKQNKNIPTIGTFGCIEKGASHFCFSFSTILHRVNKRAELASREGQNNLGRARQLGEEMTLSTRLTGNELSRGTFKKPETVRARARAAPARKREREGGGEPLGGNGPRTSKGRKGSLAVAVAAN